MSSNSGSEFETDQKGSTSQDNHLGGEIRAMRRARNMTLDDLARESLLSVGFLSLVERGHKRPSLDALRRISSALGVEVGWLFPPSPSGDPVENTHIVRKNFRRRINYSKLSGSEYLGEIDYLLSPSIDGQSVMSLMHFKPGGHSGDDPFTHAGEELGFVLTGQLTLEIEGRAFVLEEGDSFSLTGDKPHRYINSGSGDLEVILVNTPVIWRAR